MSSAENDLIEASDDVRAAWDSIAKGYDTFVTPTHIRLAEQALRMAGAGPDTNMLDVAAGTGALSVPALRLGAHVTAVDVAPKMIAQLEERVRQEGLSRFKGYVMDGHALDLADGTFDLCGSQFGVMLFPDLPRGLSEMARVTRRGGRVMAVAYGPPAEVEFIQFFMRAMQEVLPEFPGLPADPPPLPFQVADPRKLRTELERAGLRDVRVETVIEKLHFDSGDRLWDWLMNSNPIPGQLAADLNDAQKREVQRQLDRQVGERAAGAAAATLTNPVNIGLGIK